LAEDLIAYFQAKSLVGSHVLITAGPTYEAIDPVRGITNLSSGKMGYAVARAAREAGAHVTLVSGPVSLATPRGVSRIDVRSAREMFAATLAQAPGSDMFIATAAVADWRVSNAADQKIKKDGSGAVPQLQFAENPDILAAVACSDRARSGALFCVGFAAESQDLLANAQAKRLRKNVPLLVGNIGPATFGLDDNALLLVTADGVEEFARDSKLALARRLVARCADLAQGRDLQKAATE
jgi:phosphopantothenoylcysteine decarboxylase/phosphopantothenate--cysteine ligase